MSEEEYLAALLAILTNPSPAGVDPADPYGQADDGVDRYDGFGSEVRVEGLRVVDGPHGEELEVTFHLALPAGDPDWDGVPDLGATRVPFDEQWRELSGFTDPAAYAPDIASKVMTAAGVHVHEHQHGGRRARARAQWRARARATLPDRETQRELVLRALAAEGEVTQVAPNRVELRLRHDRSHDLRDPADVPANVPADDRDDVEVLGAVPDVITFVLEPEEWEEVLISQQEGDLELYIAETLSMPDPDERFVVLHEGHLRRSTRPELPPVRGRARERAWARLRAEHPPAPADGWYAFDPNDPDRRGESPGAL